MKRLAFVVLGIVIGFAAAAGYLSSAQGANNAGAYRQLNLFSEAFERVRDNYVRPVDDSELINAAIEGMVSSLDPHSSYMDRKAYSDFQIQIKGEFSGVGIEVTMEGGLIKVISPIDDTPAAKAGLKTGDFIAAIDGKSIQGMALNDAIDKMRGTAGTKVTLTICGQATRSRSMSHWSGHRYKSTRSNGIAKPMLAISGYRASTSRPTRVWNKPCATSKNRSVRRSRGM